MNHCPRRGKRDSFSRCGRRNARVASHFGEKKMTLRRVSSVSLAVLDAVVGHAAKGARVGSLVREEEAEKEGAPGGGLAGLEAAVRGKRTWARRREVDDDVVRVARFALAATESIGARSALRWRPSSLWRSRRPTTSTCCGKGRRRGAGGRANESFF